MSQETRRRARTRKARGSKANSSSRATSADKTPVSSTRSETMSSQVRSKHTHTVRNRREREREGGEQRNVVVVVVFSYFPFFTHFSLNLNFCFLFFVVLLFCLGEQVKVLCTLEGVEHQDEDELKDHCYALSLTDVRAASSSSTNAIDNASENGSEEAITTSNTNGTSSRSSRLTTHVDTLEVSSVNRTEKESSSAVSVTGIARRFVKCWRSEDGKRTVICVEASIPSHFPSSRCEAVLDLKQYLRYPLGKDFADGGGEDLFEHFLCRRWTKRIEILSPLTVESFVSAPNASNPNESLLSVTIGNILPNRKEFSGSVLALQHFQLLSDPPGQVMISEIYPKKVGSCYQEILPGTEYSFAIRTCFASASLSTSAEGEGRGEGEGGEEQGQGQRNQSRLDADLLICVSSNVSSSQLVFIHHTEVMKQREGLVQMEITHLGDGEGEKGREGERKGATGSMSSSRGLAAPSQLHYQYLIKNMTQHDMNFKKLVLEDKEDEYMFMDTCIPVGVVRANSTKAITCSVVPLNGASIIEVDKVYLVDDRDRVYSSNCTFKLNAA